MKEKLKVYKLTEKGLTNIIKNILEQELEDETLLDIEDIPETGEDDEDLLQDLEAEVEQILSPEEILGLMDEQIHQLQDRVQYMEELNADVLEFISYLMSDLSNSPEIDLKKSKAKLRNLETRSGREIFWLKSRRL